MDLTFTVTVLHHNTAVDKAKLISEMWRVTKPGGWLAFMEQFVVGKQTALSTVYPMSILSYMDLVLDSTLGRVVLDHIESIRYPGEYLNKTGLLILRKIG
jgi:SAM-dependent methyltransferase